MSTIRQIRRFAQVFVLALASALSFNPTAVEGQVIQLWVGKGIAYDPLVNPVLRYNMLVQVIYVNEFATLNFTEVTDESGELISLIRCEITREANGLQTSDCDNGTGFGVELGGLIQLTRVWVDDGSIEQIVQVLSEDGLSKQLIRTVHFDGEVRNFFREELFRH